MSIHTKVVGESTRFKLVKHLLKKKVIITGIFKISGKSFNEKNDMSMFSKVLVNDSILIHHIWIKNTIFKGKLLTNKEYKFTAKIYSRKRIDDNGNLVYDISVKPIKLLY